MMVSWLQIENDEGCREQSSETRVFQQEIVRLLAVLLGPVVYR